MKRTIFIGNVGCGKTTLSRRLNGESLEYKKTQAVDVIGKAILDTPGEYLELKRTYRGALMNTSADAEIVALTQSAVDKRNMFSPCYAGAFAKKVIGVVTKIDLALPFDIGDAENILRVAGASDIFRVSSYSGEGIEELRDYLEERDGQSVGPDGA